MVYVEKESCQIRELLSVARNDLNKALKDKKDLQHKIIELEFNSNRALQKIEQMVNTNYKMSTDLEKARKKEQSLVIENENLKKDLETADNDFKLLVSEAIGLQNELESSQINKHWLKNKNEALQKELIKVRENNKTLLNTTSELKQKLDQTTSYNKILVEKNQKLIKEFKTVENKEEEKTEISQYCLVKALEENQNRNIKSEKLLQTYRLPEKHNLKIKFNCFNEELKNTLTFYEMLLKSVKVSKRSKECLETTAFVLKIFIEENSFIFKNLSNSKVFEKDNPDIKEKLFSIRNKFIKVQNILRFLAQVRFDNCLYMNYRFLKFF